MFVHSHHLPALRARPLGLFPEETRREEEEEEEEQG